MVSLISGSDVVVLATFVIREEQSSRYNNKAMPLILKSSREQFGLLYADPSREQSLIPHHIREEDSP